MLLGRGLRTITGLAIALAGAPAWAQPEGDELVRMGRLATLGPLCEMRDEAWAFDLRRAELQRSTDSKRFDDEALQAAPGSKEASVALSYAEMEALEDFAETPPSHTCGHLARDPELGHADEVVRAFRAQRARFSDS